MKAERTCRSSKLVWWAEHLAAFNYDVQYVRGLDNTVANTLAQLPLPSSMFALPQVSRDITLCCITEEGLTLAEMQMRSYPGG